MRAYYGNARAICEQLEHRRLLAAELTAAIAAVGLDGASAEQPLADVQAGAFEVLAPYRLEADVRPGKRPSISLNWNSEGYRQYIGVRIYYRLKAASDWAVVEIPHSDVLSAAFNATDWGNPLSPGKAYQFKVTNYAGELESAPSNTVEATLPAPEYLPVPRDATVAQTSGDSAVLTWRLASDRKLKFGERMVLIHMLTQLPLLGFARLPQILAQLKPSVPFFDGFRIQREDAIVYFDQVPATSRSYQLTGLSPGESHQYWLTTWRGYDTTRSWWTEESDPSNIVDLVL